MLSVRCIRLSYARVYKISLAVFLLIIIVTAIVSPKVEGYGDFVAKIALFILSLHWLLHCVYAYKFGKIDTKGFMVLRNESPKNFWFAVGIRFVASISFLVILYQQTYT
jgi:hypothetical protein